MRRPRHLKTGAATLARLALVLLLLIALAGLLTSAKSRRARKTSRPKPAAAQQSKDDGPSGPSHPAKPLPPKLDEPWPPRIPLQRDLRFTLRPTLLGLVPPGDPAGFGECFVRVTATLPLQVHYEIKEQHEHMQGSRAVDETAIRRGEVSIAAQAPLLDPPLLWTTGDWTTASGLLWLQPGVFASLKQSGMATFDLNLPTGSGNAQLAEGLNRVVAERREAYGLRAGEPTQLIVQDWQAAYPAYVNGRRADLPAIRCTDSVRLATYWFLDDADNPLLLKMTYIAPALAESEPPRPAEKPVEATGRHGEKEKVQMPPAEVKDPAEALIDAGGGFAVVNVDF